MNKSSLLKKLRDAQKKKPLLIKWRPILALIGIYIIFFIDIQWLWGVLFLYWVVPDLISGVTYFMEPVSKQKNPMLYWSIVISWILMSILSFYTLFT